MGYTQPWEHAHKFCETVSAGQVRTPHCQHCPQKAVLLYLFLLRQGELSLSTDAEALGSEAAVCRG